MLRSATCLAACLLSLGCGSGKFPVSGKALFRDGTAAQGEIRVIRFEPTADTTAKVRKTAFADLEPDGSFDLFTRQPGDGVYRGKYAVTFTVFRTAQGREPAIAEKFTSAKTTPFTVEVNKPLHDLIFEIEPR